MRLENERYVATFTTKGGEIESFTDKQTGNLRPVTPGDIVILQRDDFYGGEPIVKRVIATEGQTVDIDFDAGVVYVDGAALEEPYTREPTWTQEGTEFPLTVPEGSIFVMGDNRNHSSDSRSSDLGTVDTRYVIGKAAFLIFPGPDYETEKRDFKRIGVILS